MRSAVISRAALLVLALALMAVALRLHLYWIGARTIPVTTDEALTVLQALDVRNGEWPLLLAAQPYMFPLEAYWMAPLVNLLPRTALGMRALVMLEGLAFTLLSLAVLRQMGAWREVWPGALLVLFPSVYLVMNQTAYSLPHNHSAYVLALAAAWLVFRLDREPSRSDLILAAAAGFFTVLAFSNAMLALSLVLPLAVVAASLFLGRGRWLRLPAFALGGSLGLLPYLAAIWKFPGAHRSVASTFSVGEAIERLWAPTIARTLPVTFGFNPCLFPDSEERLAWGQWGAAVFPYVFCALLAVAAIMALHRFSRSAARRQWPRLGAVEWAVGVMLLSLILFALSRRADSTSYRYLGTLLVVFPVLMAGLHRALPLAFRPLTAGIAIALALYNAATAVRLPREWRNESVMLKVVAAPDLKPALQTLKELGIRHAVASHWAAYRIGFESEGEVICAQPQNERFPGWPLPYKDAVDAESNVAYVLTERIRFLKPSVFERHLRTMGVEAQRVPAGEFVVYHGFRSPRRERLARIEPYRIRLSAGEAPELVRFLMDGSPRRFWRSATPQRQGMWIECAFDEPVDVAEAVLHYGDFAHDRAPALRISVLGSEGWTTLHERISADMDKFAWKNGRPVYGHAQQTFEAAADQVRAVRFEIAEPNPAMAWTLAELTLYGPRASDRP